MASLVVSVKTVKTEMSVFDSPDQFSQSGLKFMNSMMDKSKEEKFSIDIDVSLGLDTSNLAHKIAHNVRQFQLYNITTIVRIIDLK